MTRGTISIYLFIPLKVTVYTSGLEKLKHDCAGAQSTHVCPVQSLEMDSQYIRNKVQWISGGMKQKMADGGKFQIQVTLV